jgi:hypothetical protein
MSKNTRYIFEHLLPSLGQMTNFFLLAQLLLCAVISSLSQDRPRMKYGVSEDGDKGKLSTEWAFLAMLSQAVSNPKSQNCECPCIVGKWWQVSLKYVTYRL